MLIKIKNDPVNYAWGSKTLLADAMRFESAGQPMAEVWFGTHPVSEAYSHDGAAQPLSQLAGHRLNFMLKFLAAGFPLSIQVHPGLADAQYGFAAEQAAGLAIDDPQRNFKDANAKREAIVAVTDFDLLAGLKTSDEIAVALQGLIGLLPEHSILGRYAAVFAKSDTRELISTVLATDIDQVSRGKLLDALVERANGATDKDVDLELVKLLADQFGSDPGLIVALFMKRIKLAPAEAVFVETGVPHCYLGGLGVEILNSSDNVLRGGLTNKYISPALFASLLDEKTSLSVTKQSATTLIAGLKRYDFPQTDFALHRVEVGSSNLLIDLQLPGESILVCTGGELVVSNSLDERIVLSVGEAAYLANDAKFHSITGVGDGYLGSAL